MDVVGSSTILRSLRATRKGGLVTAVGFLGDSEKHDLIPEIVYGAKTSMCPQMMISYQFMCDTIVLTY